MKINLPARDATPVGHLLRHWRQVRRKSQFELSLDAGISARHLSFVESGRSNPSRDMVLLLARTLDVPYRERNDLLTAAGFVPLYREVGWSDPELATAQRAIDLILRHQEPFPAVVMDRHWNLLSTNGAADRLFGRLLDGVPALPGRPNVIRLMFHPNGLRPWVANWADVAPNLLQRVQREAVGGVADDTTRRLLEEVRAMPGVLPVLAAGPVAPTGPLLPVKFRREGLMMDYFSTVTTLGTPCDITLQEIRVECFFPADEATARAAQRLQENPER